MAEAREDDTLRALHAMRAGAAPESQPPSDEDEVYSLRPAPEAPPTPATPLPPSGPPSSADYSPANHSPASRAKRKVIGEVSETPRCCLHCGYLLSSQGRGQCSECGKQFAELVLERWFGGEEQNRFEKVRWLIAALLFAKMWYWMPYVGNYANFVATIIAAFALFIANNDKADSMAGLYALAAGVASVIGICMATSAITPYYYCVDLAVAGLLLAVILTDSNRFEVLGQHSMKIFAFVMLFAAPLLGVIMNGVIQATKAAGISATVIDAFSTAIPFALNVLAWSYVLWCVHFIYRTLFHPDVLDES